MASDLRHTTADGIVWARGMFKGADAWARVVSDSDDAEPYGNSEGKVCIKYKNTPKANWYWGARDSLKLHSAEDAVPVPSTRRSKRGMSPDELHAQEEEQRKRPRVAANGKLYGLAAAEENRAVHARGNDRKDKCAKCAKPLSTSAGEFVGFVDIEKERTVKRHFGGDSRRAWSGTFSHVEREFFDLECWEVPKSAQKSLRGLIDIAGFEQVADAALRDRLLCEKLPLVHGARECLQ